jgi:hypothetical protein
MAFSFAPLFRVSRVFRGSLLSQSLDGSALPHHVGAGAERMVEAIITFLGVCAIVAIYMWIVHRFLRASEQEIEQLSRVELQVSEREKAAREPEWVHRISAGNAAEASSASRA